ncbi:hypothetical protein [Brevibacterium yomogidense]|uniref:hypothetical protein n=1 Tax=Brevibacterium yomogidense TaxID=946573 RepID=UPI0018DF6E64
MWRIDGHAVLLGLRLWTTRQTLVAAGVAVLVGVLIGVATVLIPNTLFARDVPPVWWDVPVLVLMAVLTGMLAATYVRDATDTDGATKGDDGVAEADGGVTEARGGGLGTVGTVLAWFAVGCPVCNKIALLALGYTGALTYFAPLQPVLAVLAIGLTGVALLWRLQGRVVCSVPQRSEARA